jgi:CRP-like cAMP-binding protein
MDTKQAMLSSVPLFAGLRGNDLAELAMNCEDVNVPAGRELAREGQPGQEFFVIVDGTVRIERGGTLVRDLGPGDYFGELALLTKGPRTATATAVGACRLVVLTRPEFLSLIRAQPAIGEAILEAVGERLARLEPDRTN